MGKQYYIYSQEAYNRMLLEAIERKKQDGVPPDVVKAAFDKWWDDQFDKSRGKLFQEFKNRMDFEDASEEDPETLRIFNPDTGERRISKDGGKTWQKTR